jgi:hypothetical protein
MVSPQRLAAKFAFVVTAAAGIALQSSQASADTFFDLNFTQIGTPTNGCCGPFDVSAVLDTVQNGSQFNIVGITGTVSQGNPASDYNITGLISPPSDPGGYFGFNNIVYGGSNYTLDSGGVGFYAAGGYNYYPADPMTAYNIYDNGAPNGILSTTASYDVNTPFEGTYSITLAAGGGGLGETPLPATLPLFASGLGALGVFGSLRRKQRRQLAG